MTKSKNSNRSSIKYIIFVLLVIGLSLYFKSWIPVATLISLIIIGVLFSIYVINKEHGDVKIIILSQNEDEFISEEQFRRIKESEQDETIH